MRIPGFITVRTSSTRLPAKCLLPFGDGNVLEHVIRRASFFGIDPIVCTTIETVDDVIEAISISEGVQCFRGSVHHKLDRWLKCCDFFGINAFHTVDADDPFFDGELIRESFALLNEGYHAVFPTDASSAGNASVGYSLTRDIVAAACNQAKKDADTEMMWYFIEKVPWLKKTKLSEQARDPVSVRLTLDYEEDYWLLRTIKRLVGTYAERRDIDNIFRKNPDLFKINWFRNQEWQELQRSKQI